VLVHQKQKEFKGRPTSIKVIPVHKVITQFRHKKVLGLRNEFWKSKSVLTCHFISWPESGFILLQIPGTDVLVDMQAVDMVQNIILFKQTLQNITWHTLMQTSTVCYEARQDFRKKTIHCSKHVIAHAIIKISLLLDIHRYAFLSLWKYNYLKNPPIIKISKFFRLYLYFSPLKKHHRTVPVNTGGNKYSHAII